MKATYFPFSVMHKREDGVGGLRDGDVRDDNSHLRVIGK